MDEEAKTAVDESVDTEEEKSTIKQLMEEHAKRIAEYEEKIKAMQEQHRKDIKDIVSSIGKQPTKTAEEERIEYLAEQINKNRRR